MRAHRICAALLAACLCAPLAAQTGGDDDAPQTMSGADAVHHLLTLCDAALADPATVLAKAPGRQSGVTRDGLMRIMTQQIELADDGGLAVLNLHMSELPGGDLLHCGLTMIGQIELPPDLPALFEAGMRARLGADMVTRGGLLQAPGQMPLLDTNATPRTLLYASPDFPPRTIAGLTSGGRQLVLSITHLAAND